MMRQVFDIHVVPHVVHADRGTSMTSKSVANLLKDLGGLVVLISMAYAENRISRPAEQRQTPLHQSPPPANQASTRGHVRN